MQIQYDVFLSRKDEDAHLAKELYDFLTEQGLKVFDAEHSLHEMGNADYSEAIDEALLVCKHLIVVGSSIEHINAPWVKAEWRFFLNRKRSGKAIGNLLTVTGGNLGLDDLPPSLQNFEVILLDKKNFNKILSYTGGRQVVIDNGLLSNGESNKGQEYFQKGKKLYDEGKYSEAYISLLQAADVGNALAQYHVGYMYHYGLGVQYDYLVAMQWYLLSQAQNNDDAQVSIGILYANGSGVEQSFKTALGWYLKAAEHNNSVAQCNLGIMYAEGQGVEKNYEIAMQWYLKSANQSNAHAQKNIGIMYENGQGVKTDFDKAMKWYLRAADQNYASAYCCIGYMYAEGRGVKQNYLFAMDWYLKAAEKGDLISQNNIGIMYLYAQGVEKNLDTAKEWFLRAARGGYEPAKKWLKDEYNITEY